MAIFVFLFLFMGAFAAVFTHLVSRVLFPEALPSQSRKARNIALIAAVILPPILFAIFTVTRPDGSPLLGALIPAVWVLCMLAGIALGLSTAHRSTLETQRHPAPR